MLMAQNNQTKPIDNSWSQQPTKLADNMKRMEALFGEFGQDPLAEWEDLVTTRMETFTEQSPSFEDIFHSLVNNNKTMFRDGLLCVLL